MSSAKYEKFIESFRKNNFDSLNNNQLSILITQIIPVNFIKSLDLLETKTLLKYMTEKDLKSIFEKSERDFKKKMIITSSTKDKLLQMVLSQNQLVNIDQQIKLLPFQEQKILLNSVPDTQFRSFINAMNTIRKNELIENVLRLSKIRLQPILVTLEKYNENEIGIF